MSMKVLICGGPKDGETLRIPDDRHEIRFMVAPPMPVRFPMDPRDELVRSEYDTVINRVERCQIALPNGKECTILYAATADEIKIMDVRRWLDIAQHALSEGCVL